MLKDLIVTRYPDEAQLTSDQHAKIKHAVQQLKMSWKQSDGSVSRVSFDEYLPKDSRFLRRSILWRLVPIDLEQRCRRGQSVRIETYVHEFPELSGSVPIPAELLLDEFMIRKKIGESPTIEEYQSRFPQQFNAFLRLVKETNSSASETLRPPPAQRTTYDDSAASTRIDNSPHSTPPPPESERTVGDGRYKLKKRLGRGQYGEVWLGEAQGGVPVAIKIIRFPIGHQMTQTELRALQTMKELRHSFLLKVQAYWVENDQLVVVMDLADKTLEDRFKECKRAGMAGIPVTELVRYIREAAEGIDHLHKHKIIHRDIKPANILLLGEHAYVGDFGLARVLERDEATLMKATTIGTPLYMPPESYQGAASEYGDQYSLAVTYAELRSGEPPFAGNSVAEVMNAILQKQPDLSNLEEEEQRILRKALSKKPQDRFPTCSDFAEELHHAMAPDRRPIPRRVVIAAIGATTLVVAGLFALLNYFFGGDSNDVPLVDAPAGFTPVADTDIIYCEADHRRYYKEIEKEIAGITVRFVLVPRENSNASTFYMMKTKVWNELFAQFASANPEKLSPNSEWIKGAQVDGHDLGAEGYPNLPVVRVTVEEAYHFCQWIGGELPTPLQWDTAAGYYIRDKTKLAGPFNPEWQPSDVDGIAINRKRPVDVGMSLADVSPYGVLDMAGNGTEWTCETTSDKKVPLDEEDSEDYPVVILRGGSFTLESPLTYTAINDENAPYFIGDGQLYSTYDNSFRVVVTP